MRIQPVLLLLPAALLLSACDMQSNKSSNTLGGKAVFRNLSYTQALAAAKKENKIVMLDFGASW